MLQALKVGYESYVMVCVWQGKGDRLGMLADMQAFWHDSTVHVWRFFPPKVLKQMTVTSLGDVTDVLMYIGGRDKRKCTWDQRTLVLVLSLVQLFRLVPWLVHLGSHRPSNLATLVPLKEWNYNQTGKCSLFVHLYVPKVILGTLSWYDLVVCKLVR